MMKTRNINGRRDAARRSTYAPLAAVALIAAVLFGSFAGVPIASADGDGVGRGIDANAARYQALGEYYLRTADADTARWVALGQFYTQSSTTPYTDVSMFYAERMRAQARQAAMLAANPELRLARRSYRAPTDELVLNPELRLARAGYRLAIGLCTVPAAQLSENPELRAARQMWGC